MSGHSKWSTIKRKKGAADAKRGNIFTKHAKNIIIAAKGGSDPTMNSALQAAIDNAKKDNMPNSNIDKAVKKGSGELKGEAEIIETMYEGYGPEGLAVMVVCHTDNLNRTISSVRHIFSKFGGNMGEKGCVSYMFRRKGLLNFEGDVDKESLELLAIESGCEDISDDGEVLEIITKPEDLHAVKAKLEENGFKATEVDLTYIPDNNIKIDDQAKVDKVIKFMETMEEDDDVHKVIANFEFEE